MLILKCEPCPDHINGFRRRWCNVQSLRYSHLSVIDTFSTYSFQAISQWSFALKAPTACLQICTSDLTLHLPITSALSCLEDTFVARQSAKALAWMQILPACRTSTLRTPKKRYKHTHQARKEGRKRNAFRNNHLRARVSP